MHVTTATFKSSLQILKYFYNTIYTYLKTIFQCTIDRSGSGTVLVTAFVKLLLLNEIWPLLSFERYLTKVHQ